MTALENNTILIIDSNTDRQKSISSTLKETGFRTLNENNNSKGFTAALKSAPSLILSACLTENINGLKLLKRIRLDPNTQHTPVIMLADDSKQNSCSVYLDEGADDYLTDPVSSRELLSRIKARLRRLKIDSITELLPLEVQGLKVDIHNHCIYIDEKLTAIGTTEFRLLHFFISHRDRVYNREQLTDRVWGCNVYIDERTVDVHILRLRKILAPSGYDKLIQTVRGVGYRFSDKASA